MGWSHRKRENSVGYEDNAALGAFGGYQPADSPGYSPQSAQQEPESTAEPGAGPTPPARGASRASRMSFPRPIRILSLVGAVGAAAILLFSFNAGDDDTSSAVSSGTTPTPAPPRTQVVVPPVVDGWQSVAGGDGLYAYDVPPSWTPRPSTMHGWYVDGATPGITLTASAFTGQEYCAADPDLDRGGSGVASIEDADPEAAATQAATTIATHAYTAEGGPPPTVSEPRIEQTEIVFHDGERAATIAIVDVTRAPGAACGTATATVGAIAVHAGDTGEGRTPVLAVYVDQGYPGATTPEQLERMLRSLRAVPEADRTTVTSTPGG